MELVPNNHTGLHKLRSSPVQGTTVNDGNLLGENDMEEVNGVDSLELILNVRFRIEQV